MIDWHSTDTVLLDMDGTLLDLHFDNHFWLTFLPQHFASINDMPWQQARDYLYGEFRRHQGSLNWYCLDFWSDRLQLDIVELKHQFTDKIVFRPHAREFLKQLAQAGKRRVLVTNAHRGSLNIKLQHTQLEQLLDVIVSSHDYQKPKEDPDFWHKLRADQHFDRDQSLLIDDSKPVLRTAKAFGIGQLLRVHQPDSTQPGSEDDEFTALYCFSDIFPAEIKDAG